MKILVVPDTQCRPGATYGHLAALGNYAVDKKPDAIIHLGDHWDMPSLSTYTPKSSMAYHGANYAKDLRAGNDGMACFMHPITEYQNRRRSNKKKVWQPDLHFCYGNHEDRRRRLLEQEPYLIGSLPDFRLDEYGWKTHPFLTPVQIAGVNFCHYAQGGAMGRPISRAHLIATKKHESWVVGHQQVLDIYLSPHVKTDGSRVQCIIAGAFYDHTESYLKSQGNQHWRGALMLHEVSNGTFDLMTLSLNYLKENWM